MPAMRTSTSTSTTLLIPPTHRQHVPPDTTTTRRPPTRGVPPMPEHNAHTAPNTAANAPTPKRRPGPPPKTPTYTGPSPFSSVLAEYMWQSRDARNRQLGVGQLAIRLGVPRPTLNTWIHRNVVPDLDVVLAVLRTLNIPVDRLLAYYRDAGVPVPPLTQAEATAMAAAAESHDERPTAPMPTLTHPAPSAPAAPAAPAAAATTSPDPWDATIVSTVAALHELGLDETAIAATVERIRATQAGHSQHPQIARHVAAEHAPQSPHDLQQQQQKQQKPTTHRDSTSAQPPTTHGAGR